MPSDEEFRKVAEDVRALARSLARDFWDATQSARGSGRPTSEAFRSGLRDPAHGARREFQRGMRHHRGGWGEPPRQQGWGPPGPAGRYGPPPPPGGPGRTGAPGSPPGPEAPAGPPGSSGGGRYGPPWAPYDPWRWPPRPRRYRSSGRGPLPPVRRKWDASMLAALLAVVFGAAWLLTGVGLVHLSIEAVLAVGLMLLGAAMVVAGRTDWSLSRHAWPVLLGVGLVIALFVNSSTFGVSGALSHISFGDTTSLAQGDSTVYGGFGHLTVDAKGLKAGQTLHVQSVAGQTVIEVPTNLPIVVQAKVLAGQICINGQNVGNGLGASSGTFDISSSASKGTRPAKLYVHQAAGQIQIGGEGC